MSNDYYALYAVARFLHLVNTSEDQSRLIRLVYLYYDSILKSKLKSERQEKFKKMFLYKTKYSLTKIEKILLSKEFNQPDLLISLFPQEIKNHIFGIIDRDMEISEIYMKVFTIDHVENKSHIQLPQYMKNLYGFNYEDIKRIKNDFNLFDIKNLINLEEDIHFPKSTDKYYKNLRKSN